MAPEKAVDMATDTHEGIVVESKKRDESAELKDTTGALKSEAKLVIRTTTGAIADMFKDIQYINQVRTKLRTGERVTVNAKDAALSAEDIQAIHDEAALNAKEGGKGSMQIADVHSGQHEELVKRLGHLGVAIITHERTFNAMSAARVTPANREKDEVPEQSYEGMKV